MTIDEQIEILKAVKEGKKIEARWTGSAEWTLHQGPCNFVACDYRIVREPRRFIIAREPGMKQLVALPYSDFVPEIYPIVCIAVEEENLKTADVAKWAEKEAARLVNTMKGTTAPHLGTPSA